MEKDNRRFDLQQFFISANSSQENHDFDLDKFTDEYIERHPEAMIKPGHIRIKDKIYFEPEGLPKPSQKNIMKRYGKGYASYEFYVMKMRKYEASKQLIEVKNVAKSKYSKYWFFNVIRDKFGKIEGKAVKNNQPCEAEVKGESATIISLNK